MITTLKDTTAQAIQNAIMAARQSVGAASGMVFTLLTAGFCGKVLGLARKAVLERENASVRHPLQENNVR